uniref:INO80 complex subunit E n=1 Tax=Parastrongyloides trichosuri TaxID=131310 RepID=A0A0N5A515_PARTI
MPDLMETNNYTYDSDIQMQSDDNILDCDEEYSLDNYMGGYDNNHIMISSEDKVYMKKIKILKETYCTVLASNYSLKNRVYHVKKQINYLRRLKRVLCNYLNSLNDKFQEGYLEIDDNDAECIGLDEIIGNVVKDCKIAAALSNRKRRNVHNEVIKKKHDDSASEATHDETDQAISDFIKEELFSSPSLSKIESQRKFHIDDKKFLDTKNTQLKVEETNEPPEKKMALDYEDGIAHNDISEINSVDHFHDFLKDEDVE